MINYPALAYRLAGRHVKRDEDMPAAYRQGARPLHDDWPPGLRWIPRRWTAYRLPMPAKKIAGNADPEWVPVQDGYPLAPDAKVETKPYYDGKATIFIPHVLTMHPRHPAGQWSRQAVWLDGAWRECYLTWTKKIFGKEVYHNRGLKPDVTLGDWLWHWPEISLTT